jgi:hypothetical protein
LLTSPTDVSMRNTFARAFFNRTLVFTCVQVDDDGA